MRAQTQVELRNGERFAVAADLRFSYSSRGVTYLGTGRTRDFGQGAICFETDQQLDARTHLELRLTCPISLQNVCPLELIVRGRLVRKEGSLAVVRMDDYEFHTLGARSFDPLDSRGITCDVIV